MNLKLMRLKHFERILIKSKLYKDFILISSNLQILEIKFFKKKK